MKKRRLVLIVLALLSCCILAIALQLCYYPLIGMLRNEPFYGHMPASYWKEQMEMWTAKQPPPQPQWLLWWRRIFHDSGAPVRPQVLDGGTDAVPVLIELVKSNDLWTKVLAIRSLARLGPDAQEAIPILTAALDDRRIVDDFDEPGLTHGGGWADCPLYREAAEALGCIGPDAKAAVPTLIALRRLRYEDFTFDTIDQALKQIDPEAAAKAGVP